MKTTRQKKSIVILSAKDKDGRTIFTREISFNAYYEGKHQVIDSQDFRREQGVRKLLGEIYDLRGVLVEEFENQYAANGAYEHGRAKFEDGTIQED